MTTVHILPCRTFEVRYRWDTRFHKLYTSKVVKVKFLTTSYLQGSTIIATAKQFYLNSYSYTPYLCARFHKLYMSAKARFLSTPYLQGSTIIATAKQFYLNSYSYTPYLCARFHKLYMSAKARFLSTPYLQGSTIIATAKQFYLNSYSYTPYLCARFHKLYMSAKARFLTTPYLQGSTSYSQTIIVSKRFQTLLLRSLTAPYLLRFHKV